MKIGILAALILLSNFCFSAEFTNSVGFGFQYGGLMGWQGSISNENFHGRVAVGWIGLTVGADININEHISFGGTVGGVGIASIKAFNINYSPEGKYNKAWRMSLDFGKTETSSFGKDSENFAAASIGYSFE